MWPGAQARYEGTPNERRNNADVLGRNPEHRGDPSGALSIPALAALMSTGIFIALSLRHRETVSFWPYVIGAGSLSWAALYLGGFHPALALVPIVPFMPHEPRDLGVFHPSEKLRADTLNQFEHWWATPVQFILLLFGFANAGVPFEQIGPGTYYVVVALLLGKPVGILLFSGAARVIGGRLPPGLQSRDLLIVGIAAAIGFTVSLFFATAAFPGGAALAETKMGALLSFVTAPLALVASWASRLVSRKALGARATAKGRSPRQV
jgi:Na+:H+ antiporter, NhaA family